MLHDVVGYINLLPAHISEDLVVGEYNIIDNYYRFME
jgi:hypothetical protein